VFPGVQLIDSKLDELAPRILSITGGTFLYTALADILPAAIEKQRSGGTVGGMVAFFLGIASMYTTTLLE